MEGAGSAGGAVFCNKTGIYGGVTLAQAFSVKTIRPAPNLQKSINSVTGATSGIGQVTPPSWPNSAHRC
jgi:hypothetical protein